jgi:outer membrane receptor for ferrienterochelin and colicins
MARALRSSVLALNLALAPLLPALAQTGSLAGKVTSAEGGKPISGVSISAIQSNGVVAANASTRSDGSYRMSGISAGTYLVRISLIGYTPKEAPNTVISANGTATVDAALAQKPIEIEPIVVTAVTRVPEKQTDAPAAAFVVGTEEVQERPALTVADHLKSIPGVDISQGGLVQSNVVARGFNNIFSGALLTLIDYRYAAVPSLRINVPTFFPTSNEDIEKIEFVLGPGAALYGPNSANGVLNILTKSPFTSVGTTLSLESGARAGSNYASGGATLTDGGGGVWRVTGRHAMRLGSKVAFKVSGNYLKGTEWRERDVFEPDTLNILHPELQLPAGRCNAQTGCRDFNLEQWGGEARVDVRPGQNSEIVGTYGITDSKSFIEYTGIGAAQARGWRYSSAQLRYRYKRFFVQGFGNFSGAGIDSSGSVPLARAFLLRDGNPIVDQSRVWSAQFQHGFDLGAKETVLYGGDYIYTDARTGGTINGSNENDDNIKEIGGYVHSVTRLTPQFDFVAALRLDKNSRLEGAVWSPRAALVFKPDENQAFRVTFNRAFDTPSNNNLFLDIVANRIPLSPTIGYNVRALGVPKEGFQFRVDGGCGGGIDNLCMRTPFPLPSGTPSVLPARAALLWQAAVGAVCSAAGSLCPLMQSNPPTNQVSTQLRSLTLTTGGATFVDIAPSQVTDIARLKPTISHEIEAGYKALIGGRFQISVDAWYEHKRNFTGPLLVESPTVFLDRASTISYLTDLFTQAGDPLAVQHATALGTGMAGLSGVPVTANSPFGIPLGTVVPTNSKLTERPDIFLTYRNFGKVTLWGSDLALDYVVGSHLSLSGSYSYVNKDFFPRTEVNGPTDIALNASKSKGSATIGWRDDVHRWSAEARVRAVKGFPINSGVYFTDPDPADPGKRLPIDSYGVLDLQGTWRPPVGARNLLISANLQNVANKHYATFVGVPNLGRLFLTKLTYTF